MRRSNLGLDPSRALSAWSSTTNATADGWIHYTCKLVTPLYGGGVRTAEVDQEMPIRASGIRGQLRFWWRLACCGPFEPSESMFQREAAIWGGIAGTGPSASQVAVRVDQITGLAIKPAFVYQPNHKKPGELKTMPDASDWVEPYALFPARGELSQDKREVAVAPHRLGQAGLGFRLGGSVLNLCMPPIFILRAQIHIYL
jgi:CRISPR-associated protein Cmr1